MSKKQDESGGLEKSCAELVGWPRYKVSEGDRCYCELSKFKFDHKTNTFYCILKGFEYESSQDHNPSTDGARLKEKIGCPYLGKLLFPFENGWYAVNCTNPQKPKQEGRDKNDEI